MFFSRPAAVGVSAEEPTETRAVCLYLTAVASLIIQPPDYLTETWVDRCHPHVGSSCNSLLHSFDNKEVVADM